MKEPAAGRPRQGPLERLVNRSQEPWDPVRQGRDDFLGQGIERVLVEETVGRVAAAESLPRGLTRVCRLMVRRHFRAAQMLVQPNSQWGNILAQLFPGVPPRGRQNRLARPEQR